MANAISWFEIPAVDFDRAVTFYGAILDTKLTTGEMGGYSMAFFPTEGIGGAVVHGEGYTPSMQGVVPYLTAGDDLTGVLSRVEGAGGKILQPKTQISEEIGFMAFFEDTEGNKIGLFSQH